VDKKAQREIVAEVARISPGRVGLGIKFLRDYPAIRSGELLRLKEGDILRDQGVLIFPKPKERRPQLVPLFDDDVAVLRKLPSNSPDPLFPAHA
jgi:integrase